MMSYKAWIILGCVISVLEVSEGNINVLKIEEPGNSDISNKGESRKEKLVSALKKGEFSIVKKCIEEGVLEEYYLGIYDKKGSTMLTKIKDKVNVLSDLLQLKLVSIPKNSYIAKHSSNMRLFNVTLIPGTDLSVSLLVNLTTIKDESLTSNGKAPLHIICSLPDVEPEIVKVFLDFGTIGIDTWDESNQVTALIIAAARGNFDLVQFLVENGADINNSFPTSLDHIVRANHQYDYMNLFTRNHVFVSGINVTISAVLAAAYENRPEVLRYLIENGGDVKNKGHSWFLMLKPSTRGHKEVVEILLKKGIDVNTKGPFGSTTLHRVAETGNTEMAKLLLMYGADSNLTNNFGWTPLHVAALLGGNNTKSFVELLLDSGCNTNALTDGGFSPLNLVVAGCDLSFLDYLVRNADSLKSDKHTHLTEPKQCEEHSEAMKLLLNRGAEIDNQDDILGWTALHWAAAIGDLKLAKSLVEEYGTATYLKSKMGMSPFRTAKHFGRKAVSEYLNTDRNLVV